MKVASFFSGCGGLDLGFKKAGFDIVWANDNAKSVWDTFEKNFPNTILNKSSIKEIDRNEIPNDLVGIIGGPPCQSWSAAGSRRGIIDKRGLLFFEYINIIAEKEPLFFIAENVQGLLAKRNAGAFEMIKSQFENAGYKLYIKLLNAADYNVPQNRKRIFFVGYRYDVDIDFVFPDAITQKVTVKDSIFDLRDSAVPALNRNTTNNQCTVPNHEYWVGDYSYIFMSRNRVLDWKEQAYTVQASGRQTSIHPSAPKMIKVEKDVMKFAPGRENLYRRLTVRECARLQTFPDDFELIYDSLGAGYQMIGNSVPVNLAYALGKKIHDDMHIYLNKSLTNNPNKDQKQTIEVQS